MLKAFVVLKTYLLVSRPIEGLRSARRGAGLQDTVTAFCWPVFGANILLFWRWEVCEVDFEGHGEEDIHTHGPSNFSPFGPDGTVFRGQASRSHSVVPNRTLWLYLNI